MIGTYVLSAGYYDAYYKKAQRVRRLIYNDFVEAFKEVDAILTPATPNSAFSFDEMKNRIGNELETKMRDVSIQLYQAAADYAATRGIIIADTKFEFGLDDNGVMHLMDEGLTAYSSRFWPVDSYAEGISPPSFDKQFVRDYLETLNDWGKTAPAPALPADVIEKTGAKYREALQRLTGQTLKD
jgi:phosphoribosylaminoimidazole-succinocarboxamide synthase